MAVTSEVLINHATMGDQRLPQALTLADGTHVAIWLSDGQDGSGYGVYSRHIDSFGNVLGAGDTRVNTYVLGNQTNAHAEALEGSGYVVVWDSYGQDGSDRGVYAKRFSNDGIASGTEFRVNTTTVGDQFGGHVVALADGGFAITFSQAKSINDSDVYIRLFDASGTPRGQQFRINDHASSHEGRSRAASGADGTLMAVWQSDGEGGAVAGVYGRMLDGDGSPLGAEFQIMTTLSRKYSSGSITGLKGGGFIVTWSFAIDAASGYGIFAQRFDAVGASVGQVFQVNASVDGNEDGARVVALSDGGWLIAWEMPGYGGDLATRLYAQRYNGNGDAVGGEFCLSESEDGVQMHPSLSARHDGGWLAVWTSTGGDSDGVIARIYGNPVALPDSFYEKWGSMGDDNLSGTPGPDRLIGLDGNDTLFGLAGDDSLLGGGGNDWLDGGPGADTLVGGAGSDVYIVENVGDVVVELADEGTDEVRTTLTSYTLGANIEFLTYTGSGVFTGNGNDLDNRIQGGGGNDNLTGGGGQRYADRGWRRRCAVRRRWR